MTEGKDDQQVSRKRAVAQGVGGKLQQTLQHLLKEKNGIWRFGLRKQDRMPARNKRTLDQRSLEQA